MLLDSKLLRCSTHHGSRCPITSIVHGRSTKQTGGGNIITCQPYLGHTLNRQQQTQGQQKLSLSQRQLPLTRQLRQSTDSTPQPEAQLSASEPPLSQEQRSGRPAGRVFQPCLRFTQQGKISWALDMLQQLITEHGSPERPDGDAILLVRLPSLALHIIFDQVCLQSAIADALHMLRIKRNHTEEISLGCTG